MGVVGHDPIDVAHMLPEVLKMMIVVLFICQSGDGGPPCNATPPSHDTVFGAQAGPSASFQPISKRGLDANLI